MIPDNGGPGGDLREAENRWSLLWAGVGGVAGVIERVGQGMCNQRSNHPIMHSLYLKALLIRMRYIWCYVTEKY
jgi:hypothetical protein